MGLLGAAGSFNTFVIFLFVVFCSAVAAPESVADNDDEDSLVEERGAAVEVDVTDIVDK